MSDKRTLTGGRTDEWRVIKNVTQWNQDLSKGRLDQISREICDEMQIEWIHFLVLPMTVKQWWQVFGPTRRVQEAIYRIKCKLQLQWRRPHCHHCPMHHQQIPLIPMPSTNIISKTWNEMPYVYLMMFKVNAECWLELSFCTRPHIMWHSLVLGMLFPNNCRMTSYLWSPGTLLETPKLVSCDHLCLLLH